MITLCETWDELRDWAWDRGITVRGNWGESKVIELKVDDYLQCPFHLAEFSKYDTKFDGESLGFALTPMQQHMILMSFYEGMRGN
jgi:hypothetical protein